MANSSSIQDVCLICTISMHASFECPFISPSDVVNEQVNAIQEFPLINYPNLSWRSQNVKNLQAQSSRPAPTSLYTTFATSIYELTIRQGSSCP